MFCRQVMCCDVKGSSFWSHICPATAVRKQLLVLVLRLHLMFRNIFCIIFFLMSESRADGRQSSVLHIWSILGCFQVQQCAACAEVHLRWPDLLNFVVFPSGKWHHGAFCPSFLCNMCSVSQAETAPGFAVCVEKSLWLNSDPALHKLPCKGPMSGIALSLHPEWFPVSGILCWVLLPFDQSVGTALCCVFCRNMGGGFLWAHGDGR